MGFYTEYKEGNMIIPTAAFPLLREALPHLKERYHVTETDEALAARDVAYYEQMLKKAEKEGDHTWGSVAKVWLALPEETRSLLSVMRAIASDGRYSVDFGTEMINGEEVEGFKIFFDEKKNWDWSLLSDLGPFLMPGTYIQVDDDNRNIRRYIAKGGSVDCVRPSWG